MAPRSKQTESFSLPSTTNLVDELEKTFNDLSLHTRRPDVYPFDMVAGEMLSKAFALSRSAILLIQNGYPDEAFGLCRSLYECSMYLRYITQKQEEVNERANKFLHFGLTSKAFWFDLLHKSPSLTHAEREDLQRYKTENLIPDDAKRITQPWSEVRKLIEKISKETHPADGDASTEDFRLREKAISYTDTSCYVHCTQPGLNTYTFEWKEPIVIRKSKTSAADNTFKSCMVIQVHLRAVARYCLYGMNAVSLDELKSAAHIAADILTKPDEHE